MRLSEWRKTAPNKEALSSKVIAMLRPVLEDLGAESDAECWVAWGDDPESRYSVLAPTDAGLISVAVRLTGVDGPRATAKLIRWTKVSVSELGLESSGGHRLVAVQVESLVLKGMDNDADRICEFVRGLIAGIDGRTAQATLVAPAHTGPGRVGAAKRIAASGAAADAVHSKPKAPPMAPPKGLALAKPSVPPKGLALAKPNAPRKAAAPKRLHAVPAARAGTAGFAVQRAADWTPSQPALRPGIPATTATPSALPRPAVPAPAVPAPAVPAPAAPARPKPIAARAAARRTRSNPDEGAGVHAPAAANAPGASAAPDDTSAGRKTVEPEPDRSEWIGPHSIEEAPSREPNRPRPWTP
jgi:hypothetical protein